MKNIIKKIIVLLIFFIFFVSSLMPSILAYEEINNEEVVVEQKEDIEKDTEDNYENEKNKENDTQESEINTNSNNNDKIIDEERQNEIESIEENNTEVQNDKSIEIREEEKDVEEKDEEEESEEETEEIQEPKLTYSTHVQDIGWQKEVNNCETAGTEGRGLRLEALKINIETQLEGTIQYSTHIENIGWQEYVENGKISGTTGKLYRLEALKIRLTGELEEKYDIYYRTHIQNLGWLDWAKNGEEAGTQNFAYRMEAIQINLVEKDTEIKTSGKAFLLKPNLNYRTHIENIGWQEHVNNGYISGTQGQGLRLEGIKIKVCNTNLSGSINYSTHIQNIGWQNYVEEDKLSGTTGRSLRLEGIKIKLIGELAEYFDIYYRTHVQNMGWIAWAKNGEEAGTEGYSYRLEAIQIQIVPKGEEAPGNTRGHFYIKALETKSIEGIKLVYGNVCAGIDVSEHNKDINWQAVKNVTDFAIIRCGYGQNFDYQDDKYFESNIQNCIANNIPVEVYLYSYADTVEKASSEADHVMRLCNKYKNNIRKIWYDVEDNSVLNQVASGQISKEYLGQIIDTFSNKLKSYGYDVGLYTYSNALSNYFPSNVNDKYELWIANYPGTAKDVFESTYSLFKTIYKMWQLTSSGVVNGIVTNVDLNIRF